MDNKKRMMFILEEDYYFITIKLLSILKALDCDKKPFEDYRKLGIVLEAIKSEENIIFLQKLIHHSQLNILIMIKRLSFFSIQD